MTYNGKYIPSALTVGLFFFLFVTLAFHGKAWAPPPAQPYTTSAHGDSGIGVKRTAAELADYSQGNCAHCHEQHASIRGVEPTPPVASGPSPFALFDDTDPTSQTANFCFNCHVAAGGLQSGGGILNYNYGTNFGGGPIAASSVSVYDAFNPAIAGSVHSLNKLSTYIQPQWPATFNAVSNPCSGCHNPHYARKNNLTGVSYDASQAAITRPSDHNNLWGDEAIERMDNYVVPPALYRAPFFVGATPANNSTRHEPDGISRLITSPEVEGSTTPDYNTFCLDCHANIVGSYTAIDWSAATGDKHGAVNGAGSAFGNQKAPYTIDGTSGTAEDIGTDFVLSCLDCHEPHGISEANNAYLLRTTVNGTSGITFSGTQAWYNFCVACHDLSLHAVITPASPCSGAACHYHSSGKF